MAKEKKRVASSSPPGDAGHQRADLVAQLEDVALFMEILGEDEFRMRAYRLGAAAIRAAQSPLEQIASGEKKIEGVGESLRKAIGEFLATGEVEARADLAAKVPLGILELMKIPGLGPKRAAAIYKTLGIKKVSDLESACRANRLTEVTGFGSAVQQKILKGIEQLREAEGKLRLDEATLRAAALEAELRKHLGADAEIMRVGGLGRSAEIVESIELYFSGVTGTIDNIVGAVASLPWEKGVDQTREEPFATPLMSLGGTQRDGIRVTLWVSENKADARTLQWLCADTPMRDEMEAAPGAPDSGESPESGDAFAGYEASWIETEWFDAGRKPPADAYRVRSDGHVRGVFHCHTSFSDGRATLEQIVRAAEARGYEYIGIADHSRSATYANGLTVERVREQRRAIDDLQKQVSIKIFHGIESEILQDGTLDYDEETLAAFDFVVGSIHSHLKMHAEAMTARIARALKNPHLTFWGHPTGRLLLVRKGYEFDWSTVLDAAAEAGVVIELNSNPRRLDIDWRLGGELEKRGLRISVNPDAHDVEGFNDMIYGERIAEKAMLRRSAILNLMNVNVVEKFLCERKKRLRK